MTDPSLFKTENPPLGEPKVSKEDKLRELEALHAEAELREGLPHIHGWKWYTWARDFFESTNHINLLCAANQISKSSTQIRKAIHWATETALWPELWNNKPKQFWYLYPTRDQVSAEFMTKWTEFLPAGKYKDDPKYGWKEIKKHGDLIGILFHSGVYLFFKTYAQDPASLQTGTCDALFCDEELPVNIYEELMMRISASNGYFHMVFTATLGQEFWRQALEPAEGEEEKLPGAWKRTISLYDAMVYEDGTPSHWVPEKIAQVRGRCSTHTEVLKRVYGKFIVIGGRKYESFDIKRHMKPYHNVPRNWLVYVGADPGSGGAENHPAALCYVAVNPQMTEGRVFLGARYDGIITTAGDLVEKHLAFRINNNLNNICGKYYDWGCKDFDTISTRMGEPFEKAEKSHEIGEAVLNTLFKNNMLFIYDTDELGKLGSELATLKRATVKNKAKDDFADALRYAVTKIPWDWSVIIGELPNELEKEKTQLSPMAQEIADRRKAFDEEEIAAMDAEFAEWNEAYGS